MIVLIPIASIVCVTSFFWLYQHKQMQLSFKLWFMHKMRRSLQEGFLQRNRRSSSSSSTIMHAHMHLSTKAFKLRQYTCRQKYFSSQRRQGKYRSKKESRQGQDRDKKEIRQEEATKSTSQDNALTRYGSYEMRYGQSKGKRSRMILSLNVHTTGRKSTNIKEDVLLKESLMFNSLCDKRAKNLAEKERKRI